METKRYVFKTLDGQLAWAEVSSEKVTCYIPQYGDWYNQTLDLLPGVEWRSIVEECLHQGGRVLSGDGVELSMQPGEYYPRIWRGFYDPAVVFDGYDRLRPKLVYGAIYNSCIVAAESLFLEVKELFRVVEPSAQNAGVYGHRLRELIILLCTEVEACWLGVMKANGKVTERPSTQDYFWTCEPLRLSEWKVRLKDYDVLLQPFAGWAKDQPTQSIPWYFAYNKIKHDREGNFEYATLMGVLQSAAALHILQLAQFGPGVFNIMHENRFSIFELVSLPDFPLSDIYYDYPLAHRGFDTPKMF